jgi:hypothetical protein
LRALHTTVNEVLVAISKEFDAVFAETGRPSIPPERLMRASLLQVSGWMKQVGGMRKAKLRGLWEVGRPFLMTAAAFNLWRIPKLRPAQVRAEPSVGPFRVLPE